jgi:hypothetical protein
MERMEKVVVGRCKMKGCRVFRPGKSHTVSENSMTPLPPEYPKKIDWLIAAIASHDSDKCLMWPFAVDRDGYGRVCFYEGGKKIRVFSHRAAFHVAHGRWPEPLGLHSCDTPGCFNPRHIFEGTHADNHLDQVCKGRTIRGTMQVCAKLTEEIVAKARKEYVPRCMGFHRLAKKYGVTKQAMRSAVSGKTWRHVV